MLDRRTLRSIPESGARRLWWRQAQKGSKLHLTVDTLAHLLAAHVTPATADDRAQVGQLAQAVQAATGESVDLAYDHQGYMGEKPAAVAREYGIALEVVKLSEAKRGFVLLPRRWVVERTLVWATRFRHLVRDYERLPQTLAYLHVIALVCVMLRKAVNFIVVHNSL